MHIEKEKSIFVLGTDTDIGKTYVSSLIFKYLESHTERPVYFKPVVSGGLGDIEYILENSNLKYSPSDLTCYHFEKPVSPHIASRGTSVSIKHILAKYNKLSSKHSNLLIEGCGGVFCPIFIDEKNSNHIFLKDIVRAIPSYNILVSNSGLGSLNQMFSALSYCAENQIKIDALVLNRFDKNNEIHRENLDFIKAFSNVKDIITISLGQTSI